MSSDKQVVQYYTSDEGIYISSNKKDYRGKQAVRAALVNGKVLKPTHHPGWHFIEGDKEIYSLQETKWGGYKNIRYELREISLEGDKFPLVITQAEAHEVSDDDGDWNIGEKSPFYPFRSLYRRLQDRADDIYVEIEFETEYLGRIVKEHIENVCDVKYKVRVEDGYGTKEQTWELKSIASYYEIEKMLVSELLLHNRPCYLSSKATYDIIRSYVKDNIVSQYASITSDYDFCFTIKKRIGIKPYTTQEQIYTARGKSYRPPKFRTRCTESKQVEIFEMTSAEKKYQGYTVIEGFKGDNLQDLADNIKGYLDELMAYVNLPVVECGHCNGTGHILQEGFKMNEGRTT